MLINIPGYCPACGQHSLHTDAQGRSASPVHCLNPHCPDKGAAAKILLEGKQRHHIVALKDGIWTLKHPIRERIGDKLLECEVAARINEALDQTDGDGIWQVSLLDGELTVSDNF